MPALMIIKRMFRYQAEFFARFGYSVANIMQVVSDYQL